MAKKIKVEKDLAGELLKTNKSKTKTSTPKPQEIEIKFKLGKDAVLPAYATDGDACMDITATEVEYDLEKDLYIYHTGVSFESPKGMFTLGAARSSNCNTDCYLTNGIAVIDSATFRGNIQFRYKNRTSLKTRATQAALLEMQTTPWYKKIFKSSDELMLMFNRYYAEQYEYFVNHALDFAPYPVGARIGQITFIQFLTAKPKIVEELSQTERGEGGFGHTGK